MREIRTSGLMSGDRKRSTCLHVATAPVVDSTQSPEFSVDLASALVVTSEGAIARNS